jgi:hypothetical protein
MLRVLNRRLFVNCSRHHALCAVFAAAGLIVGATMTYSFGRGDSANANACIPSVVLASDLAGIAKVTDTTDSHPRVSDMISGRTLTVISEPLIDNVREVLAAEIERCHQPRT